MTSSELDSFIFNPSEASDCRLVTIPSCASFSCYRRVKIHCSSSDAPLTAHLTNWPISPPLDNQTAQKSCLHFILISSPGCCQRRADMACQPGLCHSVSQLSVVLGVNSLLQKSLAALEFLLNGCSLPVFTVFQKNNFLALLIF